MTEHARRPTSDPSEAPRTDDEEVEDLGRLVSQAIDIAKYAPIAILLDGPSMLPQLAEQGKVHVKNAQWLGRMFVQRSGRDLRKRAEEVGAQAFDLLRMLGAVPDDTFGGEGAEDAHRAPVTRLHPRDPVATPAPPAGPSSDELAIPDYDSLSASHVVNRLPSLSSDELDAVYSYESARRGRKTILNKIAQLRAE